MTNSASAKKSLRRFSELVTSSPFLGPVTFQSSHYFKIMFSFHKRCHKYARSDGKRFACYIRPLDLVQRSLRRS